MSVQDIVSVAVAQESLTASNGNITLSGTLDLPTSTGPHAAVVVVHGSGPATRSEGRLWSAYLVDSGIAVLSYDKRGAGQSTGLYEGAELSITPRLFGELAADALAWVELLASRPDISVGNIGLVGVSQAGWIMPLAASMSENVAFVVSVSGPSVSVGQEIYYSNLTAGQQYSLDGTVNGLTIEELTTLTRNYAGPLGYDPISIIRSAAIPIMWLYGELDSSQPTDLCVQILNDVANPDFAVRVFPRANHGLFDIGTGRAIPYITMPGGARDWILSVMSTSVSNTATSLGDLKDRFSGEEH